MDLDFLNLNDRRVVFAAAGGALALLAGLGVGVGLMARGHDTAAPPPAQSDAGPSSLQVEMGREDPGLDPEKPLRCFVGGQFVGTATLKECAQKNGVATGSLDVGLDPNGQVAATTPGASVLQPLPTAPAPPSEAAAAPDAQAAPDQPAAAVVGEAAETAGCWRFDGGWRRVGDDMTLDACVQALFAGRCERPGDADYGRWDGDTLRLVTGRVERSPDNRRFQTLVKQPTGDCAIPHISG
ncbi:MAG: hypothetical protein WDM92_15745 [Caulobacteraceae bacterium]